MEFGWRGKVVRIHGMSDSDWIYSLIKKMKTFYEIDLLKYIRYALKGRRGCILDIGANIGNHSVFFGMFVSDFVVCFEPNPQVLPILEKNLSENKIIHKLYQLGLGEIETVASIELPKSSKNNIGAAKLVEHHASAEDSVRVVPLDSLLTEIKNFAHGLPVLALKIDVEGMEPAVLRGGQALIGEYKPDLFIEVLNREQMEIIESILKPMGYKRIVSWAETPVWHFIHRDRLSLKRKFLLLSYISLHKIVAPPVRLIYRKLRSLFQ